MDEPVRRRSFVRLVATGAVQNAGRLAAISGVAAGMVVHGVASLVEAVDPVDPAAAGSPIATPSPASGMARPVTTMSGAAAPTSAARPATLDATTLQTLTTSSHLLLAVNRYQAGPFVNRYPFSFEDGEVTISTRASSAMAQHIRRDAHVTLMLDEPATGQRLMIFSVARLLEGRAGDDREAALIMVQPRTTVRMPL